MVKTALVIGLVGSAVAAFALGRNIQDQWRVADLAVRRLPAANFPELPKQIVRYLQANNCTVPQLWHDQVPHSVISGQFARKGRTDWAVLCSKNRVSSILIFWSGSASRVSEIAKEPDIDYLQVVDGNGEIGFSRSIAVVDRKYILDHYKAYGGPKPPPMDHQGIDDGFDGKASTVLYYHRGKWLRLQGAD